MYEKKFEFEGKQYTVRSWVLDGKYKVRVFNDDNTNANGYSYTVEIEDNIEAKKGDIPLDLLKDLMELAEQDIREKKSENYIETYCEAE